MGFPVVVKLAGTDRPQDRAGARAPRPGRRATRCATAADELLAAATADDGDVALLVAPMVRGNRELIAGLARDPQFGMTVMLGVGGILAEAVADVAFRLVPITAVDAAEMIDDLSTQRLLGPFRGEPAVDREALADVLLGLSERSGGRSRRSCRPTSTR